jgi:hypothetical protein
MVVVMDSIFSDENSATTSEWLSDDESPLEYGATNPISPRVYVTTFFLIALAIAGNLLVPWLIHRFALDSYYISPYPSLLEIISKYFYSAISAVSLGLWIAQYVALWIWLHTYVVARPTRWIAGLCCSPAISSIVMFGMSSAFGPAPLDALLFVVIGSMGVYVVLGAILGILIRSSDFHWRITATSKESRFSIRALLGMMAMSAILMLGLKLASSQSPDSAGSSEITESISNAISFAIWLVWLAIATATLIWLQIGAVSSSHRDRFAILFLLMMLIGPSIFHRIGAWLFAWNTDLEFAIDMEQFVIAYGIEIGLVMGVAFVILLLPRRSHEEVRCL